MSASTRGTARLFHRPAWLTNRRLAIVVIGVALAVCAGGLWVVTYGQDAKTAVVSEYLEALNSGNAERALNLTADPPVRREFLTDDALKATFTENPITDIQLTRQGDSQVSYSYVMGSRQFSGDVTLRKDGVGDWKVSGALHTLRTWNLDTSIPLLLNGVPVATATWSPWRESTTVPDFTVFGGIVTESTGLDTVEYSEVPLVLDVLGGGQELLSVEPHLTQKGFDEVVRATEAFLSACLKSQEVKPSGCGMPVYADADPSTIRRVVVNAGYPVSALASEGPGRVQRAISYTIQIGWRTTDGSLRSTFAFVRKLGISFGPDKLTVTFSKDSA